MKNNIKWNNATQFVFTLKNVSRFVDGLVSRLHELKSEKTIDFNRTDSYDTNNVNQNTIFKVVATGDTSETVFISPIECSRSTPTENISNADEAVTPIIDSASHPSQPDEISITDTADVEEVEATLVVAEESVAALEDSATGSDEDLMLMSFSQVVPDAPAMPIPSDQEKEEGGVCLSPGCLLLVISVNYAAVKVVVDGPLAKWFHETEYERLTQSDAVEKVTKQNTRKNTISKKSLSTPGAQVEQKTCSLHLKQLNQRQSRKQHRRAGNRILTIRLTGWTMQWRVSKSSLMRQCCPSSKRTIS